MVYMSNCQPKPVRLGSTCQFVSLNKYDRCLRVKLPSQTSTLGVYMSSCQPRPVQLGLHVKLSIEPNPPQPRSHDNSVDVQHFVHNQYSTSRRTQVYQFLRSKGFLYRGQHTRVCKTGAVRHLNAGSLHRMMQCNIRRELLGTGSLHRLMPCDIRRELHLVCWRGQPYLCLHWILWVLKQVFQYLIVHIYI